MRKTAGFNSVNILCSDHVAEIDVVFFVDIFNGRGSLIFNVYEWTTKAGFVDGIILLFRNRFLLFMVLRLNYLALSRLPM